MDYEEREGMDRRCNVKGCYEPSKLMMPSFDLPRQLCSKHGNKYMKEKIDSDK
jgi:hypothetical protein